MLPFPLYLLTICGSHENAPLRSPASGNIINLWLQLLCAEIHYCICSEATFPTVSSNQVLGTTANGWGLLRYQEYKAHSWVRRNSPLKDDTGSGVWRSQKQPWQWVISVPSQVVDLWKGEKKKRAQDSFEIEGPLTSRSDWFQPCRAREGSVNLNRRENKQVLICRNNGNQAFVFSQENGLKLSE